MRGATEFDYLLENAAKYGSLYLARDFEAFLRDAAPEQLDELANAYREVARRGDADRISRFIDMCFNSRAVKSYEEYRFSQQLGQLLALFKKLGEKGIPPFSTGEARYIEPARPRQWEHLPSELQYLRDPAEAYGKYCSEDEILRFLSRATPEDITILSQTATQIRVRGHQPIIDQWLKQFPFDEHQEAWYVYWLFGVMDHAGLEWE